MVVAARTVRGVFLDVEKAKAELKLGSGLIMMVYDGKTGG